MLYLTTRNRNDSYTVNHALSENRSPDGGFYVPKGLPKLEKAQIEALAKNGFSQNAANVINLLFQTKLDSWAIEFAIGRYPVKLVTLGSRETVAETWHNPAWRFERLARGIEKAIRQSDKVCPEPTDWVMIASRMAVLFGIFGEMLGNGTVKTDAPIDVAVPSGDFAAPMAVWYAREMGLPIANIIVCCNENGGVWNLLHKGEIRTDTAVVSTDTPLCDRHAPSGLEYLISASLGIGAVESFLQTCEKGGTWYLEPNQQLMLRRGIETCVVSKTKMESTILNLYKTNRYLCDPYTALCYSAVGEYRSKTGQSRPVLIWSEESPIHFPAVIGRCMNIGGEKLKALFNEI